MSTTKFDKIEARQIAITNKVGATIATLGAHRGGGGCLTIHNKEGKPVADLRADSRGVHLSLSTVRGPAVLLTGDSDHSALTFWNGAGNTVVNIFATLDGSIVALSNKEGNSVVQINGHDAKEGGGVDIFNGEGKVVASLP